MSGGRYIQTAQLRGIQTPAPPALLAHETIKFKNGILFLKNKSDTNSTNGTLIRGKS